MSKTCMHEFLTRKDNQVLKKSQNYLRLRPDFFDLLDYVTRRPKKLGFQKIKKKIWSSSGEKRKLQATWFMFVLLKHCNFLD